MPSSVFRKVRARLADAVTSAFRTPNRIDSTARVHSTALVRSTQLSGPVVVEEHATLVECMIGGPVHIGRHSSLWGPDIFVLGKVDPIVIGNFCSIARHVSVHGYGHDPQRLSTHYIGRNLLGRPIEEEIVNRGETRIGHDVWLGAGVHVMAGVTIGTGAIIGAGSVVTKDIPSYAIAVGAPARVVRSRFDEATIERLLASEWWTWRHEEIARKEALFTRPIDEALLDEHL